MALTMLTRARVLVGRDAPPPRPRQYRAGPLSFDLDGVDVRHVLIDGVEVVNRIYVGVRDTDWNTLPPRVTDLDARRLQDGSVSITFQAGHQGAGIDFRWRGEIRVPGDGTLTYLMDGTAEADFRHNRIGFCVLHPASVAGAGYRAATPDAVVEGTFPDLIAPQEVVDGHDVPLFPAFSSLAVAFTGLTAIATFEGDLFEVEDQRNWTDASFKTYCTPIGLGYPHSVRRGQVLRQRVTLSVEPATGVHRRRTARRARLGVEVAPAGDDAWPHLGLGSAPGPAEARRTPTAMRRLRALALDHLRIDVRLDDAGSLQCLDRAFADADALGCRLEVALFAAESTMAELPRAAARLADPRVARVIALYAPTAGTAVTPRHWFDAIHAALASTAGHHAPVFIGTDGDFAELNRDRPDPGPAGVAYAVNPQVHASDDLSLVETLSMHGVTVATARAFGAGAVAVSPITLRGRFNPAAAQPVRGASAEPPSDPRQPALFTAGWTLGSLASLIEARADAVTYFETDGPRGVLGPSLGDTGGAAIPAGTVYPVWFALADLADRRSWRAARVVPGAGPVVTGVAMRRPRALRVLLANVTPAPLRLSLGPIDGRRARVRTLDAENAVTALAAPSRFRTSAAWHAVTGGRLDLDLGPYAYVRVDASQPPRRAG
jgi:hypothetical protein